MKKVYLIITVLIFSFLFCSCKTGGSSQSGQTSSVFEVTDYEIEAADGAATIISHLYTPEIKELVVPETIYGNTVTVLGENAFYQHTDTESIILPASLERIDGSPFYRCYSLKESTIPSGVKIIDSNPYFRCSSLEKITVEAENKYFCDIDGVLFNKKATTLIAYPEGNARQDYTIPATVTRIKEDAFGYKTNIKNLYILSNVTEFPKHNMFVFPQDIKLYVEAGSAAENYAKEFELNYEIIKK